MTSMLEACSSGDVAALQQLLSAHEIQPGSKPIITQCIDGKWSRKESKSIPGYMMPSTEELLDRAVATNQLAVVECILQTYPSLEFSEGQGIARTVIRYPNPLILKTLCSHDHNFAHLTMDYGFRTFFTEACEQPPMKIVTVLQVLLDEGVDVDDGWGAGGGTLYAAIVGGQPLEIIDKVLELYSSQQVDVGARHVGTAVQRGDTDILASLFSSGRTNVKAEEVEHCVEAAERTEDKAIISLVREWAEKKAKGEGGNGYLFLRRRWAKTWRPNVEGYRKTGSSSVRFDYSSLIR
ncbi:hypothetical protein BJ170DRAFT_598485 [Xylariales sp. AK1849]|nr:hypothetical protein BJ170DRAFT_598485 [Xylariales sp. AK1849]